MTHPPNPPRRAARAPRLALALLAALVLGLTGSAWAQHTLRVSTNYYAVTGATLAEIRQSLRAAHPWKGQGPARDAYTVWQVRWHLAVAPEAGQCRCRTFTTTTTIAVTLPRWVPPDAAAPEVRAEWFRYLEALRRHEGGHVQVAQAAAAALQERVASLGPQPDCATARAVAEQVLHQLLAAYRRRDVEYDERTRHGATEGAVWPRQLPGEPVALPPPPAGGGPPPPWAVGR